jgi:hypothetical protein
MIARRSADVRDEINAVKYTTLHGMVLSFAIKLVLSWDWVYKERAYVSIYQLAGEPRTQSRLRQGRASAL